MEIVRFPWTISLMRRPGTAISLARRYSVMPSGFRNSSERISPGVTYGNFFVFIALVVIDNFNVFGGTFGPSETDSPLVIDSDAELTYSSAF